MNVFRQVLLNVLSGLILFLAVCYPYLDRRCYWCGGITLKTINDGADIAVARESLLDRIVNYRVNPQGYTIHFECLIKKGLQNAE
jgi:hypothetical protein